MTLPTTYDAAFSLLSPKTGKADLTDSLSLVRIQPYCTIFVVLNTSNGTLCHPGVVGRYSPADGLKLSPSFKEKV